MAYTTDSGLGVGFQIVKECKELGKAAEFSESAIECLRSLKRAVGIEVSVVVVFCYVEDKEKSV
jgi:hypothetical protein